MHRLVRHILLLLSLAAPAAGFAQSDLTRLVTGDDSKGWEAVGRVDVGRTGFCTGTLIAPDRVLTAAHCLFDSTTLERVPDQDIQFMAGGRGSRANAIAGVSRAFIHPDYRYDGVSRTDSVWNDVAILVLSAPIRKSSITPIPLGERPRKGAEVGVVSYAYDRSEFASLEDDCHVLSRPSGALILSCSVDFGSSGAPVFAVIDGAPQIVSVVSAKAEVRGRAVSLGTGLARPLEPILEQIAEDAPVLTSSKPAVRRINVGGSSTGSGAKFVRP